MSNDLTPEALVDLAARLGLEQMVRYDEFAHKHPENPSHFYADPFEIGVSNHISKLMGQYGAIRMQNKHGL